MDISEHDAKNLINTNCDYYEKCLLATIINNSVFWIDRCRTNINTQKSKFQKFADFSKSVDNDIYNVVSTFYSALVVDDTITPSFKLNYNMIVGAAKPALGSGSFDDDLFETFKLRLSSIINDIKYNDVIFNLVNNCFDYWLETKRAKQIASDLLKEPTSIQDLIERAKKESDKIIKGKSNDSKDILSIMESYNDPTNEDKWERIPIASLPKLTEAMGGGVKKQETMLVIAPPAGGKTTISCQIAVSMAEANNKVVYITTEQPGAELLPKMISCGAMIPYNKIVDGIKAKDLDESNPNSILSKQEIKRIKEFIPRIQNNFWFEDWCSSGGKLKTHLNNTIEQHIKEHGGIDCVIIDWIGGGVLVEGGKGDLKRHFLDECCRLIKDAAIKYNVAIVACSQASQAKSEDVAFITAAEISESTMLHTYFTWALGISALGVNKKKQKMQLNGEIDNKKTVQYFNLFKTRKSKGIAYPVHTHFDYSRFEETFGDPIIGLDGQLLTRQASELD